jgi:hypothetical protein
VIEEYILDLSFLVSYQDGHKHLLSNEYERQLAVAKQEPNGPQPVVQDRGRQKRIMGDNPSWWVGKPKKGNNTSMHAFGPTRTVVDNVIGLLPTLPENETKVFSWLRFDSTLNLHKDPDSECWIAFNVRGDQSIYFNTDDGEFAGSIKYNVALVNSKKYHAFETDGNERLLLRKTFKHHTFDQMKSYLNERLT